MSKPPTDPEYRWSLRFEAGRIVGIRRRAIDTSAEPHDNTPQPHDNTPEPQPPDPSRADPEAA